MKNIKFGILGTGLAANLFSNTLRKMENVIVYAVASKKLERAESFKNEHGIEVSYDSYEQLVQDSMIDIVYIANSHNEHFSSIKLCLENKRPVLCEKALVMNSKEADEILLLAKKYDVFIMEAMWTRFIPITNKILELIESGEIGELQMMRASFSASPEGNNSFSEFWKWKNNLSLKEKKQLGDSTLLGAGSYTMHFATLILGYEPVSICASAFLDEEGVDIGEVITLQYSNGQFAVLVNYGAIIAERNAVIYGSKGYIIVHDFWKSQKAEIILYNGIKYNIEIPFEISGYEYEAKHCIECLLEGKVSSDLLPIEKSVRVMHLLEDAKEAWTSNVKK